MDTLLRKMEKKIKAIAHYLGTAGMIDTDDNEQNIVIGIMEAYAKQPTATESFLLEAGRNYARDILKSERNKQARYIVPTISDDESDETADVLDTTPHPNRKGKDAEVKEFIEKLRRRITATQNIVIDNILDGCSVGEISERTGWDIRLIERELVSIRNKARGLEDIVGYEPIPETLSDTLQLLLF